MRYSIAVVLLLALVCSASAQLAGNTVTQINSETALASSTGMANQNETNFAIVVGDANNLLQSNDDFADVYQGTINQRDANAAFILGTGNAVTQANSKYATDVYKWLNNMSPSTIDQIELNQILICGDGNTALQTNAQVAQDPGYIYQKAVNFAAIVGMDNNVSQSNTQVAVHRGMETINQSELNTAYVYGVNNDVSQTNYQNGTTYFNATGTIYQTECNMAFVISRMPATCDFVVPNGTCPVMPGCNITCPDVPCAPAPCITYPACPCPANGLVTSGGLNVTCPTQGRGCGNPTCPCQ